MTFIAGILGIPAPNGLIPQAPIHTQSLVIKGVKRKEDQESHPEKTAGQAHVRGLPQEEPIAVVEQRVSNLVQGLLSLVLLTKPFLHVLGLIPRGVLAGLFWHMGIDALSSNGITTKILFLLRDRSLPCQEYSLLQVRTSRVALFVAMELLGFGATFGVVQNSFSAVGFPIIIGLLIPLRIVILPRLSFTQEELNRLDQPTASQFVRHRISISRQF
jgi:boron transporter